MTAYSNSGLVDVTYRSPNHSGLRTHKIDRITPHCVVGQLTATGIGACFPLGRDASCNYGIGRDGKVVLVVDEKNRSWCTSSGANDQRAITIECASDAYHPYAFNNAVWNKLILLCVDICKRNGIKKLLWLGSATKTLNYTPKDGEAVLTAHRWFDSKSCPGDWCYSRLGTLANEVNKKLGSGTSTTPTTPPSSKITVDGVWGCDTTYLAQKVLKTYQDGIVSDQNTDCTLYLPACHRDSWEFVYYPQDGSVLIKAIQRMTGAMVDGIAGYETVLKLQKWLNKELSANLDEDGILGKKTCKAFQKWLNSKVK